MGHNEKLFLSICIWLLIEQAFKEQLLLKGSFEKMSGHPSLSLHEQFLNNETHKVDDFNYKWLPLGVNKPASFTVGSFSNCDLNV